MAEIGTLTLYATLVLASWSGGAALVGARRRTRPLIHAARLALSATAATSSASILVLAYAFAVSDFSISYVQHYSDAAMPLFYRLTAVWGGQQGSLLLWLWLLAVMAAAAVHINRERLRELVPYIIVVLAVVIDFFCLLLLVSANPFDSFLVEIPTSGQGLNPLLQNAYMVTHPPALYVGYVGMSIPFAFAVAALIAGRTDESWIVAARPWALSAWYFLSMGLVLGMLWAYEELGWGGYWAWDPVENAGLIPWLTSTAYVHSVMVQERRQMLKIWNVVLALLTFELTIFGTFLTRSGFIQSVHAFAQSDIGWYFLAFMGLVAVGSAGLILWRRPLLRSRGQLETVLSREFAFVINNWVLISAAFLVLVLTIFPTLSQIFGHKVTISAPAFNRWMVPIGLTLLALTGIGPMIAWRKTSGAGLRRQFLFPLVASLAVGAAAALLGKRGAAPLATFGLCAFVGATVLQELARGVRVRRQSLGVDRLTALVGLVARHRRRYGGYLVHLGVVLMFVGFAGEAYKQERELLMRKGQRTEVGDYTLRFDGVETLTDAQKQMTTAALTVYVKGASLGVVRPARWVYFKHEGQPTTEVDIRRTVLEDLFVVLGDYDPGQGTATFKIVVNPLVSWIWIGFVLLSLGTLIALFPSALRRPAVARALPVAGLLVLLVTSAPLAARADERAAAPSTPAPTTEIAAAEQRLFSQLACMCPTCPRIPLATCQCGFAGTERSAVRAKLALGWSEERVRAWYLEQRGPELGREPFGAAALTTPPDSAVNRLSWLLPYGSSALAVLALFLVGRRWARGRRTPGGGAVPDADGSAEADAPDAESAARIAAHGPAQLSAEQREAYERLLERELRKLD